MILSRILKLGSLLILLWGCGEIALRTIPTKMENFKGALIEGEVTQYNSLKGKATLVVLTASWCPACKAEIPQLQNISADYYNRGLRIVMISEDDTPQIALKYKTQAGLTWPTLHWNYELMNALGNPGVIPVSYLINQQDSIVKVNVGAINEKEIRQILDGLLP